MTPVVRQWDQRIKNPMLPQPGSQLSQDNMENLDVEGTIWYQLCVSVEHLNFALDAMYKTRTVYPTAYMTVLRTAYLASVNALWILSGTGRTDRRLRTLRFIAEDTRVHIQAVRELEASEELKSAKQAQLNGLFKQQADLQSVAKELGSTEEVRNMKVNQTSNVAEVAEHFCNSDSSKDLTEAIRFIWRDGSAAAHGQYHFGLSRVKAHEINQGERGARVARLFGDFSRDVGPAFAGIRLILEKSFELYDVACEL